MISVYIPHYNDVKNLSKSIDSVENSKVVVCDNKSDDEYTRLIRNLENKVKVIYNNENLGRVGNWQKCISEFINSDENQWMKWLFVGDELENDWQEKIEKAIKLYPEAKMIICEYKLVSEIDNKTYKWSQVNETRLIESKEAMELLAVKGNWFGSAIGYCISKEALKDDIKFSDLNWVSDMQFCMDIAKKHKVLYLKENIGTFNIDNRKYFKKNQNSIWSVLEEVIVRKKAAEEYLRITKDYDKFNKMMRILQKRLLKSVVKNTVLNYKNIIGNKEM